MGQVARQATWITLLTSVGMVLGFVNMALLFPRFLSVEEFGLTRLVVSIVVILAQVASFGAESTIIRYFPYMRDDARGHRGFFGLFLLLGLLGAVLILLALWLSDGRFGQWFHSDGGLYATYAWVVPPMVLSEVAFLMLRGISRSQHRSIAPVFAREFMLRILQTALIAAYILWRMPFALFIGLYAGTFVITTILLAVELQGAGALKLGLNDIRVPKRLRRSMVRYGAFTFGSGMAGIAVGSIDQVMLGALLHEGLANVAYYSVALFLAGLINVPARALILPTMPLLAEAWRTRDHGKIARIYHRTASLQLVVAAFILLGLWACMNPLFTFLKPGYELGKPAMLVLGLTQLVMLSQGVAGSIVSTSRKYWFDAVSSILFLVLNIGLDLLFIPWWGITGAAWSSLVSSAIVVAWRLFFLHSRYGLWPYDGRTALTLLLFAGVGAVFLWLPHLQAPVADIAVRGTLVAVLFWPFVHWLKIAPELGDQLLKLLRRLGELVSRG